MDISNSVTLVDQLRDSQDLMTSILETIREGLVVLDGGMNVLQVNKTFLDMFKVSQEETINQSLYDLGNGQWNIPALKKLLENVLPENNPFEDFEVEQEFDTIGKRVMLLNARQVMLRGRPKKRILLAIEDITDRRDSQQTKDTFISMTAHELKTPLTSIKAYNQLLRHLLRENKNITLAEYSQKMQLQIDKLQKLIFDLLEVSHIQAGKLDLSLSTFDLNELIQEIAESVEVMFPSHAITVKGKSKKLVYADRDRIGQVLSNLISNAVKYSPLSDKVLVSVANKKNSVQVNITDYGVGIEKSHLPNIFDRFYRVNDVNDRKYPGLGIGLYVASQIIARHHGQLTVQSAVGKGSAFSFSLPLHNK